MKTLDEILGKVLNEYIDITGESEEDFGEAVTTLTDALSKAKQAIIELIDGEIIGEDIKDDTPLTSGLAFSVNYILGIQRQKLQKLKE